jgi:DNA-directed RNA polymerase specialized sigma subunit
MEHFDGMNAEEILDTLENLLTELDEVASNLIMHRIKLKLTENQRRDIVFKLFEVPELITQAEIARRAGLSRQRISQFQTEYILETELKAQSERISRLKEQ